jgi:hypothetical protein
MKNGADCIIALRLAGIAPNDAYALRRIAMTLRLWFEREGNGEIERDGDGDDGMPYAVRRYFNSSTEREEIVTRRKIPDREKGANKRLGEIMKRYPGFSAYVQGDPRGASLYILRPGDIPEGEKADGYYNRGIAVYK